jgi:hypothetical protein
LPDIPQPLPAWLVRQCLRHRGLPPVLGMLGNGPWRIVLDEGRPWQHNYTDTLDADWVGDMQRFLARYRMCQRKGELWREGEEVGIEFESRMAWVNGAMEAAGEPTMVPYIMKR